MSHENPSLRKACGPLLGIVHLEPESNSLADRWYLERCHGERSLLKWIVMQLPNPIVIVCHSTEVRAQIEPQLEGSGVAVFHSRYCTKLGALAELMEHVDSAAVAIIPPMMGFAPPDLLSRAHALYQSGGYNAVFTDGLPDGVAPFLLSRDLLLSLKKLARPGLPDNPAELIAGVLSLIQQSPEELPFDLRTARLDAGGYYRLEPGDISASMTFKEARSIRIAKRVIAVMESSEAHDAHGRPVRVEAGIDPRDLEPEKTPSPKWRTDVRGSRAVDA